MPNNKKEVYISEDEELLYICLSLFKSSEEQRNFLSSFNTNLTKYKRGFLGLKLDELDLQNLQKFKDKFGLLHKIIYKISRFHCCSNCKNYKNNKCRCPKFINPNYAKVFKIVMFRINTKCPFRIIKDSLIETIIQTKEVKP